MKDEEEYKEGRTFGYKVLKHERSMESIQLIREHLVTFADDGDEDSLFCRFGDILNRVDDLEHKLEGTWNTLIRTLKEHKDENSAE